MSTRLNIDLLRNFVAIAETRAMSRAAHKVGRTQAALSQQVKRLETEVQQTLMIRSGRGITLTAQGERLLLHAQNILRTHDEAVGELLGVSLSGELRVGCPDDYARVFLPQLLREYSNLHPQVLIEVVCAPTPRLLEKIKGQMLDIAIVSEPDSPNRDQFLRREQFVWVGVKGGDAHNRDPLQLALSDPDTLDHQAATSRLERAGRRYRIAYASGSISGLTAVVRSGQAIAVLTQTAVPPDLHVLPPSSRLPKLPSIGITVKTGRRSASQLLRSFETHVRTMLPSI
ncbi:MAG TPA: LysR substrate-binding domain-containing protein [Nevskiaceae bacterium]|nr:LysR substrate-binding domain-containing protein [Nevskiaceae bacterium]